jgi:hypothetical protein
MKQYPVDSVCEIIRWFPDLIGHEVTIMSGLKEHHSREHGASWIGYDTDLIHNNKCICPPHGSLKLKRLPPAEDAWCRSVMKEVLKPLPINFEEEQE